MYLKIEVSKVLTNLSFGLGSDISICINFGNSKVLTTVILPNGVKFLLDH